MAPAEVPEMASIRSHGSSSRRSRTPQVNAPWEPPPCNAKSMRTGARFTPGLKDVFVIGLDGFHSALLGQVLRQTWSKPTAEGFAHARCGQALDRYAAEITTR